MLFSIDRIEGNVVVLIDDAGNSTDISAWLFDTPPAEGQIVRQVGERYRFDPGETAARRAANLALMRKVLNRE